MAELPVAGLFDLDKMKTPDSSDVLLAFHIDASGKPVETESGYYTIALLIQTLGQIATNAEQGAISAKTAAEAAQAACEAALAAIGNSDTTGLRGQAITAINNARIAALAAIGESDSAGARGNAIAAINAKLQESLEAWASQISLDNGNWDAKVVADNSALDQKISSANQTIDAKVTEATEQANIATTKAGEASQSAQDASGSADTATQKASEASQSAQDAADSANTATQKASEASQSASDAEESAGTATQKASEASQSAQNASDSADTATQKAGEASTSASQAAESKTGADNAKTLAERYANEEENVPVETIDGVPQYSAFHYSKKAEQAANSPLASESQAGRSRITSNPDYSRPADNTDPVAASIEALQTVRTALQNLIAQYRGYKTTIGDGSTKAFTITHNLGTQDIMPMVTGSSVPEWSLSTTNDNAATLTFTEAPAASSITVLIIPVRVA